MVLGHGFWQRRWGGDTSIVGRAITLDGNPMQVVGVVGADFEPPQALAGDQVDLWVPLDLSRRELRSRDRLLLSVVARLRPGITLQAAQGDLNRVSVLLAEQYPETDRTEDGNPRQYSLVSLHQATVGDARRSLFLLVGAVGFLLLIACANVANLLLARGTDREREMALRLALGAGRGRLIAQLMIESVALGLAGGVIGICLASWAVAVVHRVRPAWIPRMVSITIDQRVLWFALGVTLAAALLFGIVPALMTARANVNEALKDTAASTTPTRARLRLKSGLVVVEVAVAVVLLVGAGLLSRSLVELRAVRLGFDPEHVVSAAIRIPDHFPGEQRAQFVRDLMDGVAAIPGVEEAGAAHVLPFGSGGYLCCWIGPLERVGARDDDPPWSTAHTVTPGYFRALGVPVVEGRALEESDANVVPIPTVINRSAARRLFGNGNPIGGQLVFRDHQLRLVGLVDDVRHVSLQYKDALDIYVPYATLGSIVPLLQIGVRSRLNLAALAGAIRQAVWAVDPDLPVGEIVPLRERIARSITEPRFLSALLLAFSAVALLLAAAGIYGSLLYAVRRRELGIRLVLGASASSVVGMVMRRGIGLTSVGLLLGLADALGLSRTLKSLVFGIGTRMPHHSCCRHWCYFASPPWRAPYRRATRREPIRCTC